MGKISMKKRALNQKRGFLSLPTLLIEFYALKSIMEQYLLGNIPLGHLLNAKPMFMS